jgi:hypothetical protein
MGSIFGSLELNLVHGLIILWQFELNVLLVQNELFVLFGLPGQIVLVIRGNHLWTILFGFVLKMNTFALSAGAAATKTLSSIEIRKVLIFAVQKGLQVNLKKINRIRFGYNFGKNWFSKCVLLIQPHFFLSEIVILFKVGIFELEIVHLFDHLDSLVQGVRNGVEFGIFVYGLVFLLRNRFGLKVGFFSYDLKRLGLDHWFEVLLVGTFSGVVL